MTTNRMMSALGIAATMVLAPAAAYSADNCTGYDNLVTLHEATLDLGGGHTLTTFQQASLVTSDDSIYNLTTGECSGAALSTPDGKVRAYGYCARKDKDGDTQSIEFSQAAGADKGVWKGIGGTGKFAGRSGTGWFQDVRTDGKMLISKWGGSCR